MYKKIISTDDIKVGNKYNLKDIKNNELKCEIINDSSKGLVAKWDNNSEDSPISYLVFMINNSMLKIKK